MQMRRSVERILFRPATATTATAARKEKKEKRNRSLGPTGRYIVADSSSGRFCLLPVERSSLKRWTD